MSGLLSIKYFTEFYEFKIFFIKWSKFKDQHKKNYADQFYCKIFYGKKNTRKSRKHFMQNKRSLKDYKFQHKVRPPDN